jgi:hypothetical protein
MSGTSSGRVSGRAPVCVAAHLCLGLVGLEQAVRGVADGSDECADVVVPGHFADYRAAVTHAILVEPTAEDTVRDFGVHSVEQDPGTVLEHRLERARHVVEAALHHRQRHAPVEELRESTSGPPRFAEVAQRLWSVPEQRFELVKQVERGSEPGERWCLRRCIDDPQVGEHASTVSRKAR